MRKATDFNNVKSNTKEASTVYQIQVLKIVSIFNVVLVLSADRFLLASKLEQESIIMVNPDPPHQQYQKAS